MSLVARLFWNIHFWNSFIRMYYKLTKKKLNIEISSTILQNNKKIKSLVLSVERKLFSGYNWDKNNFLQMVTECLSLQDNLRCIAACISLS